MPTHVSEPSANPGFVCGHAAAVRSLNALIAEIATTDIPVLMVGESGTGKEVYARLIYRLSRFNEAPLKKVSCAALDAGRFLAEVQEVFLKNGECDKDTPRTLFLDGVHELDAACQRALLCVLPDGEAKECGGKTVLRVISSTSRNLEKEVEAGHFRRELYFRINGAILLLPPLRERKEDIPELLNFFSLKHSNALEKQIPTLNREAHELLHSYDWPGNIRELENVVKKIVAVGDAALALAELRKSRVAVQVIVESSFSGCFAARGTRADTKSS
jgi:DNA-binding NtrC family response regulator